MQKSKGVDLLINAELNKAHRLPTLEALLVDFINKLALTFRVKVFETINLDIEAILPVNYGEYIEALELPTMAAIFSAPSLNDNGAIVIHNELVYSLIEIMLGGRLLKPSLRVEDRQFTVIEQEILSSTIEIILSNLNSIFEPIYQENFIFAGLESNLRYGLPLSSDTPLYLCRTEFSIGERSGKIDFIFPLSLLNPFKSILSRLYYPVNMDNKIWENHIANVLEDLSLNVEAVISDNLSTLGELSKLKVGDTIVIDKLFDEEVEVRANNKLVGKAKLGKVGDSVAIQFNNPINSIT